MKNLTKLQSERIHAKRRALERLGINLNKKARNELILRIQSGKLRFVSRQSVRVTVWRDNINGEDIDIVYDNKRHAIVTFLYPEESGRYEGNDKREDSKEDKAGDNHIPITPPGQPHHS